MNSFSSSTHAQFGSLVQLVSPSNKVFIFTLTQGGELHTHRGIVHHDELVGKTWGSQVHTHLGSIYFLLEPSLSDILKETKRNTQIMYPKDIGYILVTMGIGPGSRVLEAGTGSGALTTALAWAVGPQGRVYSYDQRPEMQNLARKNLERVNLLERVELKLRDISLGFEEENVDALFLDVPNPYEYLGQVRQTLKSGGYFGSILPTTNQVSRLLAALYQFQYAFVDVCEIMLRYYKVVSERFRPADRMVAHTGYLIFARPMLIPEKELFVAEVSETEENTADKEPSTDENKEQPSPPEPLLDSIALSSEPAAPGATSPINAQPQPDGNTGETSEEEIENSVEEEMTAAKKRFLYETYYFDDHDPEADIEWDY
ncbi:MAG TPA: tRNA (adenine-N1)-methyltransferase [Anaerolineales bacterium]|nr:tRNA (adenine-N1)-methyltransferase [Anaerolineales bacterium]